jgi:hypothetical protein
VDGASLGLVSLYLAAFLAVLAGLLWFINRRPITQSLNHQITK